jgi:hypothetical protein
MWLRIISLGLVILAIACFIFFSYHQKTRITTSENAVTLKDSILRRDTITRVQNSLKKDSLTQVIVHYIASVNAHNYDTLINFYADTLIRYFKSDSNVSRQRASSLDWKNWSGDYKYSKFEISKPPVINEDTALVTGRFTASKNNELPMVLIFEFNNDHKINFIRALLYK